MSIKIKRIESTEACAWDSYVYCHPKATLYHLSGWRNVIEKTYGHKTYNLMAIKNELEPEIHNPTKSRKPIIPKNQIVGILPLVHLKHFLFGNSLISTPFFDLGGILADDEGIEKALLSEAIKLAQQSKAKNIELRQTKPVSWIDKTNSTNSINPSSSLTCATKSHKVRMLLDLPESSEILMKSFKAKLRSQIKKPLKEGLGSKIGSVELLEDFYDVFSINMRDLGSPVHSKKLMRNVLEEFPDESRIVMVRKDDQLLACSLVIGFKEQWGAKPMPLHWHYISLDGQPIDEETPEKSKFEKAIRYWQKLPIPITKILGPMIRKHIGL